MELPRIILVGVWEYKVTLSSLVLLEMMTTQRTVNLLIYLLEKESLGDAMPNIYLLKMESSLDKVYIFMMALILVVPAVEKCVCFQVSLGHRIVIFVC